MQKGASRSNEYCMYFLGLNTFTVCGTTSIFKCLGMVKPLKQLQSMSCFVPVLGRLGDSWEVLPDDLKNELEAFRCALRWNPRTTKV